MKTTSAVRAWLDRWRRGRHKPALPAVPETPRIGLALGGGFARGIAHVGVLRVLERYGIPIHCIAGVSAGAIVAAAYASGASTEEIGEAGCAMRFNDVARWSPGRMGFAASERMNKFLGRLLKVSRFEEMVIPLGVLATDLGSGEAVAFRDSGDACLAIRASCSYPGLFRPVPCGRRLLVDGAMSMEVPSALVRAMGATRVIGVHLETRRDESVLPSNIFQVITRCFQIMHARTESSWRRDCDLVIEPDVRDLDWDSFGSGDQLIAAGEAAAMRAIPRILEWMPAVPPGSAAPRRPVTPGLTPV